MNVTIQVLEGKSHRPAFKGQFEGSQEGLLLLSSRGEVAADSTEPLGARCRAEAAEVFCRSLIIRRSRSEPLLSNGTARSVMKRSTSSRHSRSGFASAGAGLLRRTERGGSAGTGGRRTRRR